MTSPAKDLKKLLDRPGLLPFPCCYDALSARLIERAGFALTFMSGFAVSAVRLGAPDTGLISYGEMVDQGRNICRRVPGHHLANQLEDGQTPLLPLQKLEEIGYKLVAHPFAVMGAGLFAMKKALVALKEGRLLDERVSFEELKEDVGFSDYYREQARYSPGEESDS